jgi:hypothetical protein
VRTELHQTAPMDVLRARLAAQLLTGPPATSASAVVDRLLAVQAQDDRAARLGVRARSTGLHSSDVDDALGRRELVITTVNRGTLHLVAAEDYPWLHALTTPQLTTSNARRLRQEGVSPAQAERGVSVVERELADGPRTRAQLQAALDAAGVPTARQALAHVILAATLRGLCVRGPVVDGHHAFVLVHDWLPQAAPVDRDVALGELARRYLVGHGPSTDRDLATWAGIGLREARAGLVRAGAVGSDLLVLKGAGADPVPPAPPRLLGPWDELLMGWVDRTPVLADHSSVITRNGIFRAIAVADGRAVGTWRLVGGQVTLEPFGPLPDDVQRALEAEAEDVERFVRPEP